MSSSQGFGCGRFVSLTWSAVQLQCTPSVRLSSGTTEGTELRHSQEAGECDYEG